MTKFISWMIVFGVLVLAASGVRAQSMTLTSGEIKDGATIAADQVFKALAAAAATSRRV